MGLDPNHTLAGDQFALRSDSIGNRPLAIVFFIVRIAAMKKRVLTRRTVLGGLARAAITSCVAGASAAESRPTSTSSQPNGNRLNLLSATMRPAMRGIFSGARDQRAALLDFIREAADGGKTIEWGPLDVSIDVVTRTNGRRGLAIPSGSHWVMHPETRIRAVPNDASHYEILDIMDVEDVTIEGNGARLIGERDAHLGQLGEWGFGVAIRGARNIRISDLVAENCWGDGFYIGSGRRKYCQDIFLRNTKSIRARRNGLSLISARGFRCEGHESVCTGGFAPQWGVDIEPNNPHEYLEDITFLRTVTRNSANIGFGIYLAALTGSPNHVSIRLLDCVDTNSLIGFSVTSARRIAGRIELVRPVSNRAGQVGIYLRRKAASGPHVSVLKPVITDWNSSGATSTTAARAAISIFAPSGDDGTESLGNVDILEPDIRLTKQNADVSAAIFVMDQRTTSPDPLTNVRILDPLGLAGLRVWLGADHAEFRDRNRVSERVLPDANMTIGAASTYVHNVIDVTEPRNYTLARTHPIGAELVFEFASDRGAARIVFPSGEQLFPERLGDSRSISTSRLGARLRIRKTGQKEWRVLEKTGLWFAR